MGRMWHKIFIVCRECYLKNASLEKKPPKYPTAMCIIRAHGLAIILVTPSQPDYFKVLTPTIWSQISLGCVCILERRIQFDVMPIVIFLSWFKSVLHNCTSHIIYTHERFTGTCLALLLCAQHSIAIPYPRTEYLHNPNSCG